jgi:aldehyde dehydrogenase (NAD+)
VSVDIPKLKNFIGGVWTESTSGKWTPNINPANSHDVVCMAPASTREETVAAIEAAARAFPRWKATPGPVRGKILFKAARIMEARAEELAATLTREEGKVIKEARGEVTRAINITEFTAGEGRRLRGSTIPSEMRGNMIFTVRAPIGVVGLITPWNFPVAIPIWKMAPALLAGNTVIIKPASLTPYCTYKLVQIFEEAGIPPGVLNLVMGSGSVIGDEITKNQAVHAISFTGSNAVGCALYEEASRHGKRVQCEMGGKNPLIVLKDADLDLALEGAIAGGFGSTGQRCTASSRVIVEEAVADKFISMMLERMGRYKVGDGADPTVEMGPQVDEGQMKTVLDYIAIGTSEGARLLKGGKRLEGGAYTNGYFVEPTLFDNVKPNMRIMQEEIFGPVVGVIRVKDFEEAMTIANGVKFGLSASLYSRNLHYIMRFTEEIETGKVHVNMPPVGGEAQAPFGGVKATAIGPREQGVEAFDFYTEIKVVHIDFSKP